MRRISLFLLVVGIAFMKNPILVGANEVIEPRAIVKAVEPVAEITVIEIKEETTPKYLIEVTDEDIDLMARVVMSESSILCNDAKQAVAQTIVNRVRNGRWGDTVQEVVNYPNAYSIADNGDPTEDCYYAVMGALMYEGFPTDMYYFKTDSPHNFGYDYTKIGNTYFTTETNHLTP